MAENSFKGLFIAFILVAVFVVAIINTGIIIQSEGNINQSILNNELVNRTFSGLQQDLSDAEVVANTSKTDFEFEKPNVRAGELTLKSVLSSGKRFTGVLFGVVNLIFGLIFMVIPLGVVIGAVGVILTITIIFLTWRLIKQGE